MDTTEALAFVLRRLQAGAPITIRRDRDPVLDLDRYTVSTPQGPPWPQVWVAIPRTHAPRGGGR